MRHTDVGVMQHGEPFMSHLMKRFWVDECGATAIEYGLLAAILGIGLVASLTNLQTALSNLFGTVEDALAE